MPLQRHVVPNHFRSLRTPSQSPTSGAATAGLEGRAAVGQDTSKYGRIPDFAAANKNTGKRPTSRKTSKTSFSPYEASSSPSSASFDRPLSRQRGKASPASVVDTFVAAAAEARIAAHTRLLAERRAAEEADAASVAAETASASSTKAAQWASKRPQLTINTATERARSPQHLTSVISPGPRVHVATSPLSRDSSAATPTQSPSASPRLNDGSARYRPNASANGYRVVLAEAHTDLYAWLLSRQKNFWGSRGL